MDELLHIINTNKNGPQTWKESGIVLGILLNYMKANKESGSKSNQFRSLQLSLSLSLSLSN